MIPLIGVVKGQSAQLTSHLILAMRPLFHSPSDEIYSASDGPDGVYCIINGMVEETYIDISGREEVSGILKKGMFFGEKGRLSLERVKIGARAHKLTTVSLYVLYERDIATTSIANPRLGHMMREALKFAILRQELENNHNASSVDEMFTLASSSARISKAIEVIETQEALHGLDHVTTKLADRERKTQAAIQNCTSRSFLYSDILISVA